MSRKAMLSLWGLYTYNTDLFNGLQVPKDPDDAEVFTKQDLIDNILLELAELEVLYTDPLFMQDAITAWCKKQFPVWQKLTETLFYEYDPIANYDRNEDWTDTFTPTTSDTTKLTHGHVIDTDLTHGHVITMDVEDTTVNSVTGYNGSTYGDRDKQVFSNDDTETHSGIDNTKATNSGVDSTTVTHTGHDTTTKKGRAWGNIGVTTTQQMIEAQREVVKFNVMDYIIDDFKGRFCILVY